MKMPRVIRYPDAESPLFLPMEDSTEAWTLAKTAAQEFLGAEQAGKSHWRLSFSGVLLEDRETIGKRADFELMEIGGAV